ncbi:MAG TPA: hypothetical protein VF395_11965, partial [Polyangiaceae bacterium]
MPARKAILLSVMSAVGLALGAGLFANRTERVPHLGKSGAAPSAAAALEPARRENALPGASREPAPGAKGHVPMVDMHVHLSLGGADRLL